MLITERKFGIFKITKIYFVDRPVILDNPDFDMLFYHTYKNCDEIKGLEKKQCLTTTIDLRQDIDVIWNKIKKHRKQQIRRAKKNGITVKVSDNYKQFHQIYKKFLIQKNYLDPFGLNIYSSQFMQKYGILFLAENHGEILGGNLYFYDNDNALSICSANLPFGDSLDKNKKISDSICYLHWEAIQYFKKLDVINFDLGGLQTNVKTITPEIDGLDFYKRSFGGDVIYQYEYRKFNTHLNNLLFHIWNNLIQPKKSFWALLKQT